MFDSIHRHIMAGYAVSIEFTKQGWRQFARLNTSLGIRYIRAFILKRDVAEYIANRLKNNIRFCVEIFLGIFDAAHPLHSRRSLAGMAVAGL